jgi:hypothetical protein
MQEFCSVGDDSCLVFWDARSGHEPTLKVEKAHDADLHCVDWNAHDENLLLTGYHFFLLRTCFCGSHNCQPIGIVTSQSKSLNFCCHLSIGQSKLHCDWNQVSRCVSAAL